MTLPCPEDLNNPIPETDAISLLDIQNEFGGSYNDGTYTQIKEYYRNGAYVESNDEGTTDNIPIISSPPATISFADFFCTDGEIIRYIRTNTSNPDISLLFGNNLSSASASNYWTKLRPKRLIIKNGIYVYNTNPYKTSQLNTGYAMRVWDTLRGQLIIENYGFIQGAGGRYGGSSIIANETRTNVNAGGQGGNAIYIGPTVYILFFNRYYNPSTSKHYYGETAPTGYSVVEASNYFGLYTTQASGTVPLYRLYNPVTGSQLLSAGSQLLGVQTEYEKLTSLISSTFPSAGAYTATNLNYIPENISLVTVNGIERTDYSATDGTSITFFSELPGNPSFPNSSNAVVQITKSKAWTPEGVVGYVYSSLAPGRVPIYKSYVGLSTALAPDFLFSTSSTEGPNAGHTSQVIAFYAPTSAAANPKPTIYIKNYGQIAAGGGGGGKGGDGGSESFTHYINSDNYFTGTVKNIGTVGGLGQGYEQVNTLSNKNAVSSAQNVDLKSSTNISINVPRGSNNVEVRSSVGVIVFIDSYSSNIRIFNSGSNGIGVVIAPYVTNVSLSDSGGGISVSVSSNTSNINASAGGGYINITGAGANTVTASSTSGVIRDNNGLDYPQNITNLSATFLDTYYEIPTAPGAAGPGGDGGTFGNPGGNGQNGSTSNGSPGGSAGVAIHGISYVVGGVTGNAVLGSTTQ